jgi:ankyrin repeat protein
LANYLSRSFPTDSADEAKDDVNELRTCIKDGLSLGTRDPAFYGYSLLMWSIRLNATNIFRYLLEMPVDVCAVDDKGNSALAVCAPNTETGVVFARALLEMGAEVNRTNNAGWSPIAGAIYFNNKPLLELYKQEGADVRVQTKYGESVLAIACIYADTNTFSSVVSMLEKQNKYQITKAEKTRSIFYAITDAEDSAEYKLLELHRIGCCMNITNRYGRTPLMIVRESGKTNLVRLIERLRVLEAE